MSIPPRNYQTCCCPSTVETISHALATRRLNILSRHQIDRKTSTSVFTSSSSNSIVSSSSRFLALILISSSQGIVLLGLIVTSIFRAGLVLIKLVNCCGCLLEVVILLVKVK
ncbi:hypothetical protein QVD17_00907 [Tagetes erecta]|uniref:Transmembrane protein n=1 Tax=Tagetes erecta TaxID=13708 RepID=A0AAD8LB40_TARER|nr:hypothetical protein QVD17_00907 [Tagetes erecta]